MVDVNTFLVSHLQMHVQRYTKSTVKVAFQNMALHEHNSEPSSALPPHTYTPCTHHAVHANYVHTPTDLL